MIYLYHQVMKDKIDPKDPGDVAQQKVHKILAEYPLDTARRTVAKVIREVKVHSHYKFKVPHTFSQEEYARELGPNAHAPPIPPVADSFKLQRFVNGDPNVGGAVDDDEFSDEE